MRLRLPAPVQPGQLVGEQLGVVPLRKRQGRYRIRRVLERAHCNRNLTDSSGQPCLQLKTAWHHPDEAILSRWKAS